jgi:hypothetical protein
MESIYRLRIAELDVQITSPARLQLPKYFLPFLADDTQNPAQIAIEVFSGTDDICWEDRQISHNVFLTGNGIVQRYLWNDGQYFVRLEPADRKGSCRLGVPESFFETFCESGNWLSVLAIERLLIPYGRVILHASAVVWNDRAILFTAPSGGGKSTQAALWADCGAEVLNGDKVVLMQDKGIWYACGSPVAGSSCIYKNLQVPVAAVFLVQKHPENAVTRQSKRNAFLFFYQNAVKSAWDEKFNHSLIDVLECAAAQIPVYELCCTPDARAVQCVMNCLKW